MSTTVSYKGQTLTTVSNDTKTLLTEGKYLEDDLTLTDVSGSGAVLTTKNISANGTYNASSDSADGYSQVTVDVHGLQELTYSNGYIDCSGASVNIASPSSSNNYKYLVDSCVQGDKYLVNGTGANAARSWCFAASDGTVLSVKPTTTYIADNEVTEAPASAVYFISNYKIDVSANPYCYKFVLTEEDVKSISANGTYTALDDDLYGYAQVNVNVPNSYSAGDEGKVVSNGALVAQTSDTVTQNDTYDTTLINSLTVNVSGGGGGGEDSLAQFLSKTLTSYSNAEITIISRGSGLKSVTELTSISFPNVTSITGADVFNGCTGLTELGYSAFPKLRSITLQGVFAGCSNIKKIVLPALNDCQNNYTFQRNSFLEVADLSGATVTGSGNLIGHAHFENCTVLNKVIIRKLAVGGLGNTSAFNGTPFASSGTGGTLYVPQSLISSYQSATNWSTILSYANNSIVAIEGSQYENYYADGTAIS